MTSNKRSSASRVNGRKSRGPKTLAGKARSCRNALRHGFTLINRHNPLYAPEIEDVAKIMCGKDQDPLLYEQALVIAEQDLLLSRARAHAIALIERLRDPNSFPTTKSRSEWRHRRNTVDRRIEEYDAIEASYPLPGNPSNDAPGKLDIMHAAFWKCGEDRDDCAAFCEALPELARIARYERRAWSRRRRAFCQFLAIKSRGRQI